MLVSKYKDRNKILGWTNPLITVSGILSTAPLRPDT